MRGIYRITSPSGKVYIGQSVNIENRRRSYKSNKKTGQPKIYNSIAKYGWAAHIFEIIHELPADVGYDQMNKIEEYYIQAYRNAGVEMLNIRDGGSNSPMALESRLKMAKKRFADGTYKHTEAQRLARSVRQKGRILNVTAEQRQKGADKLKGRRPTESAIKKNQFAQQGKRHSQETKDKISNSRLGKKRTPFGRNLTLLDDSYGIFTTVKEAAIQYGVSVGSISKMITGRIANRTKYKPV